MKFSRAMDEARRRFLSVPLSFLGCAFCRTWLSIAMPVFAMEYLTGCPIESLGILDIACTSTIFICALFSSRIGTLQKHGRLIGTMSLVLAGTMMGLWALLLTPNALPLANLCIACVGGVSFALTRTAWIEALTCLTPPNMALCYAVMLVASRILAFLVSNYETAFGLCVAATFPLISFACYATFYKSIPQASLPTPAHARMRFPWRIALLVFFFYISYGLVNSDVADETSDMQVAVVSLVPAVVVIASVLFKRRYFNFRVVYQVLIPCMMMLTVLVVPLVANGHLGAGLAISRFAGTSVTLLSFTVLCSLVRTYHVSALLLFGIIRVAEQAGIVCGQIIAALVPLDGAAPSTVVLLTLLVTALMCIVVWMFIKDNSLTSAWGLIVKDETNATPDELAVARARELGELHGLSAREMEVLLVLVRKSTIRELEEELCISNGTVKTHLAHIYRKFNVHGKRDLYRLLGLEGQGVPSR